MDELAPRPRGILARARDWVLRTLGVGLPAWAGSGGGIPAAPSYPVEQTLASMVQNPWFWACVQAITTDLCGLPLVAEMGVGLERTQTTDYWLLRLLRRPSPKVSGRRFFRQIVADSCSGNAYIRVWRDPAGRPIQLGRIHPANIEAIVGADGEELGWRIKATGQVLEWREVLHIADISIADDPSLVFGTSPAQPLSLGLSVDRDTRRQAGRAARRGRLEMMLAPDAAEVLINKDQAREMTEQYAEATESGHGVYFVNKAVRATPLSLTARDGEFLGITDRNRAEVLAVMAVPPTRVGDPAANYGTSKQQARTYWETLQGRAALITDELSRLADEGVEIRLSFAGVEALQTSQTERQARAVIWRREFGMSAADAASYEGFIDAPVSDAPASSGGGSTPIPTQDPTVDEPREDKSAETAILGVLRVIGGLYASGEADAEAVEITTRTLLRTALRQHRAEAVDTVAEEAAAVCRGAAERALEDGDVAAIRAFGADHARRIVELARCA